MRLDELKWTDYMRASSYEYAVLAGRFTIYRHIEDRIYYVLSGTGSADPTKVVYAGIDSDIALQAIIYHLLEEHPHGTP